MPFPGHAVQVLLNLLDTAIGQVTAAIRIDEGSATAPRPLKSSTMI